MPRLHSCPLPVSAAALLRLIWLASPALPVGGFSYSEGLEAAVESGYVGSEAQARDWLLDQLRIGLSRNEIAVVAEAFDAWRRDDMQAVRELNAWVTATRETRELRLQSEQMGRSLSEWLKHSSRADDRVAQLKALLPAPTWPVAFALAAAQSGAPLHESLLSFGFGWAENMVQATLKAVPLGQIAGQRILDALAAALPGAVEHAIALSGFERRSEANADCVPEPNADRVPERHPERQAFTPMLAILSAQHETQYSRLFRS